MLTVQDSPVINVRDVFLMQKLFLLLFSAAGSENVCLFRTGGNWVSLGVSRRPDLYPPLRYVISEREMVFMAMGDLLMQIPLPCLLLCYNMETNLL